MATDAKTTGSTKVDAIVQNVKAAEPAQLSGLALYSRFALAGAVCCSVTHGGLTPVDVYVLPLPLSSLAWLAVVCPSMFLSGFRSRKRVAKKLGDDDRGTHPRDCHHA
jgi:solute carrier family 25 phosphate transporter 3